MGYVTKFLSTPSARRATCFLDEDQSDILISIHALREEGDSNRILLTGSLSDFLSTPSARRATGRCGPCPHATAYFYPRPPRGGRHGCCLIRPELNHFYPRPPRGGRRRRFIGLSSLDQFLSTPSARRATRWFSEGMAVNLFLSTPSARRATSIASAKPSAIAISIHALREEGDNLVRWCLHLQRNFYPRPPRGGRRRIGAAHVQHDPISIHALREEGDPAVHQAEGLLPRFLSTPSARRAT